MGPRSGIDLGLEVRDRLRIRGEGYGEGNHCETPSEVVNPDYNPSPNSYFRLDSIPSRLYMVDALVSTHRIVLDQIPACAWVRVIRVSRSGLLGCPGQGY